MFLDEVLGAYLLAFDNGPILHTRPLSTGRNFKVLMNRLLDMVREAEKRGAYVTMLFDFYGWKTDGRPGRTKSGSLNLIPDKVSFEQAITDRVTLAVSSFPLGRFKPYVQMHELEALLYADVPALGEALGLSKNLVKELPITPCPGMPTPEHINDSESTSPSKRIIALKRSYEKSKAEKFLIAARAVGLPAMRAACPLFNEWVEWLESLGGQPTPSSPTPTSP